MKSLVIGISFLIVAVLIEFISIMVLNSNQLTYTLDDPYIHLALAENIYSHGHYGVNYNEFSAPSSSILWPFILSIFMFFPYHEYIPFLLNIFAAIGTVFFFWKILIYSICIDNASLKNKIIAIFLMLLILATNTVGLIFSGMEHSWQVFFVVMIVYYLIVEIETNKISPWLILSILVAPLIRYENCAVSLAAILYLFFYRYYKIAILLSISLTFLIGTFSLFLWQLELGFFPSSILVKSSIIATDGNIKAILYNVKDSFYNRQGIFLVLSLLGLLTFIFFTKQHNKKKIFAFVIAIAIFLHILLGRYDWYNRYEIYIWGVAVLTIIYLFKDIFSSFLSFQNFVGIGKALFIITTAISFICINYILGLITVPIASNNVYEQQYQMFRFATEYYKRPVAVNDLGYVSYRNANYVLDLYGLASKTALTNKTSSNNQWMNELAIKHNVKLAMIYDSWFPTVPANWKKIGYLKLGRRKITPAESTVSFYVLNSSSYNEIIECVKKFEKTLPGGVKFIYFK